MAYRRRQGITRASTFKENKEGPPSPSPSSPGECDDDHKGKKCFSLKRNNTTTSLGSSQSGPPSPSLAAKAIPASAAHHQASSHLDFESPKVQGFSVYETESSANGFWGVLARKAKAILEDDNFSQQFDSSGYDGSPHSPQSQQFSEGFRGMENPTLRKGLDRITSSLNQIGNSFEKAFEEGKTIVESKTADIKLQIRRKGGDMDPQNVSPGGNSSWQQPAQLHNHETQLKASCGVRWQLCNCGSLVHIAKEENCLIIFS